MAYTSTDTGSAQCSLARFALFLFEAVGAGSRSDHAVVTTQGTRHRSALIFLFSLSLPASPSLPLIPLSPPPLSPSLRSPLHLFPPLLLPPSRGLLSRCPSHLVLFPFLRLGPSRLTFLAPFFFFAVVHFFFCGRHDTTPRRRGAARAVGRARGRSFSPGRTPETEWC